MAGVRLRYGLRIYQKNCGKIVSTLVLLSTVLSRLLSALDYKPPLFINRKSYFIYSFINRTSNPQSAL